MDDTRLAPELKKHHAVADGSQIIESEPFSHRVPPSIFFVFRPPLPEPLRSELQSNPPLPAMLETVNKCSTPTALLATLEDKT